MKIENDIEVCKLTLDDNETIVLLINPYTTQRDIDAIKSSVKAIREKHGNHNVVCLPKELIELEHVPDEKIQDIIDKLQNELKRRSEKSCQEQTVAELPTT